MQNDLFQKVDGGSIPTSPLLKGCHKCGKESSKMFYSFGYYICEDCKNNRPNKMLGNSGMFNRPQSEMSFTSGIFFQKVPKSNGLFGSLYFSHYPQSKGIVGRSICYLIYKDKDLIGVIGCSSPPVNYKIFNDFFGKSQEKHFVVNNVFRLVFNSKNLGSQCLRLFRIIAKKDYESKYKDKLLGMATFIEPPRTGIIYKADNWIFLGMTQGCRMRRDKETWEKKFEKGFSKYIYGFKYQTKRKETQ